MAISTSLPSTPAIAPADAPLILQLELTSETVICDPSYTLPAIVPAASVPLPEPIVPCVYTSASESYGP